VRLLRNKRGCSIRCCDGGGGHRSAGRSDLVYGFRLTDCLVGWNYF
jgi:hypothetical protein